MCTSIRSPRLALAVGIAFVILVAASLAVAQDQPPQRSQPAQDQQQPTTRPGDRPATRPADADRPRQGAPGRQNAQARPGAAAGQMLERIAQAARNIDISDEQNQRLETILAAARRDLGDLLPRLSDVPPDQRRQELQAITVGVIEEIGALLTPQQRPAFREAIEQMREEFARRGQGNPPGSQQPRNNSPQPNQPPNRGDQPPSGQDQRDPGARAGQYIEQLAEVLGALELSDEQRAQVEKMLESLRQDARRILAAARQGEMDQEAAAQAFRQRMEQFRQGLAEVLSPEQLQQVGQQLQRRQRQQNQRPGNPPGEGRNAQMPAGEQAQRGMAMNERRRGDEEDLPSEPAKSAFLEQLNAPPGLDVGETLSEDVKIVTLAGKERPLRDDIPRSRPLVVFLGSMSSPSFRDRVGDFFALRKEVGRDADLLIIYTREQHAAGEWTVERNKADGIEIPQHASLEERIAAAKKLRQDGELRIEVVVDTMDNTALKELIGEAPHCAALVFAPGGELVGRQQWLDPTGIPALVEAARREIRASARAGEESD